MNTTTPATFKGTKYLGEVSPGVAFHVKIEYEKKGPERCTDGSPVTWGTTGHGPRVSVRYELSICGEERGAFGMSGGGQNIDTLERADEWTSRAAPLEDLRRLAAIWRRWHLNGMKAGCIHQREGSYSDPAIANQICPESGYKYGREWLFEEVPSDTVEWLRAFLAAPSSGNPPLSFVERLGIEIAVREAFWNPNMDDDGRDPGRRHYSVRLTRYEDHRPGEPLRRYAKARRLTVPFTMGSALRRPPTADDVIECLVSEARSIEDSRDSDDWAENLGMEPGRNARRDYNNTRRQAEKLRAFLGEQNYKDAMEGR